MRRRHYTAQGPQESFIVPLLDSEIDRALKQVAGSLVAPVTVPLALDCGCGNQPFRELISHYGFHYESLDVAQNDFGTVDYICPIDSPREVFEQVVTDKYSLVLCTEVLEHVANWRAAFKNMYYCMSEDSRLVMSAPFFYPLHEEPRDYWRPTVHAFRQMAIEAGFDIESITKAGNAVDAIGTILGSSRILIDKPDNMLDRCINSFLLKAQDFVFRLIVGNRSRLTATNPSIYLSNIVVLNKK